MYELIDKYIEKLMTSQPDAPLWNIEVIRSGKKPAWNYIDGCMMTSLIELYKTTKDEKYINFVKKYVDYYDMILINIQLMIFVNQEFYLIYMI